MTETTARHGYAGIGQKPYRIIQTIFRILLGAFLLFAGISHPHRGSYGVPGPGADLAACQWRSGGRHVRVVEIALGLALIFLARQPVLIGLAAAAFFVLIFPGNISQYINQVDAFGLNTDQTRFTRLFFQPLLVIWALWSTDAWRVFFTEKQNHKAPIQRSGTSKCHVYPLTKSLPTSAWPTTRGNTVSLTDFHGKKNVLLVFNRTFT